MRTIIVKTQAELDALPAKFEEYTQVRIEGGTRYDRIAVTVKRENSSVEAWGNSSVEARGNSSVEAWENSSVVAWGNSSVVAWGNSSVEAWGNSSVEAWENSSVEAWENSSVVAWGNSSVEARGNSSVVARENSSVEARENSSVEAWENSSVVARENSSVVAWENSSVEARGNSSVEARENSSVEARGNSSVEARGNSSVVARGNSSVEARENSSVEAMEFSMIAVLAATVVLKRLHDYATVSLRDCLPKKPEHRDKTVKIIMTPARVDISFEEWLSRGYVYADGIYKKFASKKSVGAVEVFTVQDFPKKTESYVAKRGDTFSHGETVEKAIEGLRYKLSDRDTSRFKGWKLTTEISEEDAIQAYRAITGACEYGVKSFCESVTIPEGLTVKKVVELTAGRFGASQFAAFFKAEATA